MKTTWNSVIICFVLSVTIFAQKKYPDPQKETIRLITGQIYKSFERLARSEILLLPKDQAWKENVPEVKTVLIRSSADSTEQPALFYDSKSSHKKPLLCALHSWSEDYQQHYSIPYGIWAVQNDWVLILSDYRGPFTNPGSTLSQYAIQDILDAVEYAKKNAKIDESRVYITGFSGGGMATLMMAGRYPDIWAGAAAWVPVYDLVQWYESIKNASHNYSKHIINSCGGPPLPGTEAEKECRKRSVSMYLKNAKNKNVQVYIAAAVADKFVPPGQAIRAFNDLAFENDLFSETDIDYINTKNKLPARLEGTFSDSLFTDAGLECLYNKKSANVTLKIFSGNHNIIYNAGLYWLSRQRR